MPALGAGDWGEIGVGFQLGAMFPIRHVRLIGLLGWRPGQAFAVIADWGRVGQRLINSFRLQLHTSFTMAFTLLIAWLRRRTHARRRKTWPLVLSIAFAMLISNPALASKCSLATDVFFAPNSVTMDDGSLEKVQALIKRVQRNNTVFTYLVSGHTDRSEGDEERAKFLSSARAAWVAAYIARHDPARVDVIHTESHGSSQPSSPQADKNRRVEIDAYCVVPPPYFDKNGAPIL